MADVSDCAGERAERREWLRVLAASERLAIEDGLARIDQPSLDLMRPPETGLVMMRARMGGVGRRFNLGEVTVTRCAVTDGRVVGFGYVLGRDKAKALLVARCDAMLQMAGRAEAVQAQVIEPLRAALEARRSAEQRRAAATRVDFFTLVRGEG